jgi:hypothetical protein
MFLVRGLRVGARTRSVGDGHLKLDFECGAGAALDGIAFGFAKTVAPADAIGLEVDVATHVRRQDPRWGTGVQLVVMDLCGRPAAGAPEALA